MLTRNFNVNVFEGWAVGGVNQPILKTYFVKKKLRGCDAIYATPRLRARLNKINIHFKAGRFTSTIKTG